VPAADWHTRSRRRDPVSSPESVEAADSCYQRQPRHAVGRAIQRGQILRLS
jgi:hypothetical protein